MFPTRFQAAFAPLVLALGLLLSGCEAPGDRAELSDPDEPELGDGPAPAPTAPPEQTTPPDAGTPPPPPAPTPRAPCATGSCWLTAPALSGGCGTTSLNQDFSSGRYNVHRYPLAALAGVTLEVTLEALAGTWSPALVVLTAGGETLYDGEVGLDSGPVKVVPVASGRGTAAAKLRITAQADTPVAVFVTSWSVIDGGFSPPMPQDARYTLSLRRSCEALGEVCPMAPDAITRFGSGYFTSAESSDPSAANYSPYKRDGRASHSGYDVLAPLGTPVVATQAGTIISASPTDVGDCGISVNLAASSGVTFRYCHLSKVLKASGSVAAGELIGLNGSTGNALAPHVHFVYLDAPNVTGSGTAAQKSVKVNAYVDRLCR